MAPTTSAPAGKAKGPEGARATEKQELEEQLQQQADNYESEASSDQSHSEHDKQSRNSKPNKLAKALHAICIPVELESTPDIKSLYRKEYEIGQSPDKAPSQRLTTWIVKAMLSYEHMWAEDLTSAVVEDFDGWTEEIWKRADPRATRALKKLMTDRNILMPGTDRWPAHKRLAAFFQENDEEDEDKQGSGRQNQNQGADQSGYNRAASGAGRHHQAFFKGMTPNHDSAIRDPTPVPTHYQQAPVESNPYQTLPPPEIANEPLDANWLELFTVAYSKALRYTGEMYDLLDFKVLYFTDTCEMLQIPLSQLHALFPMALGGRARRFFIQSIGMGHTFREIYLRLQEHFDTPANKQQYYNDWCSITFQTVRSEIENAGKSNMEVLQIMLDKLDLCQKALGPGYQQEHQLVATILRAVHGVPEFKMALASPEMTFEGLSSQLRATLRVEESFAAHGISSVRRRY